MRSDPPSLPDDDDRFSRNYYTCDFDYFPIFRPEGHCRKPYWDCRSRVILLSQAIYLVVAEGYSIVADLAGNEALPGQLRYRRLADG